MQCIFNPNLRCLNTRRYKGEEKHQCWSDRKDFLEILKWYFDNALPCIPFEFKIQSKNKKFSNKKILTRAEVYGWFQDFLYPEKNNIELLEPWLQSGALDVGPESTGRTYMTQTICDVLKVAEVHYLNSTLRFKDD